MKTKAVLGLDVAQASACYHLTDAEGQKLAAGSVSRTLAGWTRLLQVLRDVQLAPADCLVGVEATGDHHLPWCEALTAAGATVFALNPLVAKRTRPVSNAIRDYKDDPIDAEGIARVVQREAPELTRFVYHRAPLEIGLRKLIAAHEVMRRCLTNLKKHTGALRQLVWPGIEKSELGPVRLRRVLQMAPTPKRLLSVTPQDLASVAGDQAAPLAVLARDAFVSDPIAEASVPALLGLLHAIDQLETEVRRCEHAVQHQAALAIPPEHLALARSLPAFGAKTTPVVLAFVPPELWTRDQRRKKKVARIQARFGIDPRRRKSGKWKGKIKMSKRGSRLPRTAMYQIAMCSLMHDPALLADYHHRTRVLKKPHKVAIFDIARKHLRRLVAVMESRVPYVKHPTTLAA